MQTLQESRKFSLWRNALTDHGNTVRHVEELHSIRKRNGEILFSLVKIDAESPEGNPLLPIALLRGHFVSVVTCLIDQASGERYFLLVRQRRVANGALFYEHPAGMMDSDTDPAEVAMTEVYEETGMQIKREDLQPLNQAPYYSSPGLIDEGGYFFACELEMDRAEIMQYHEQSHGHGGEGEFIQTVVATEAECFQLIRNTNGVLGLYLYKDFLAQKTDNQQQRRAPQS